MEFGLTAICMLLYLIVDTEFDGYRIGNKYSNSAKVVISIIRYGLIIAAIIAFIIGWAI